MAASLLRDIPTT